MKRLLHSLMLHHKLAIVFLISCLLYGGWQWTVVYEHRGSTQPGTCAVGQQSFDTDDGITYRCTAANTWTQLAASAHSGVMTRNAAQSIAHNTEVQVLLDTVTFDVGGITEVGNNRFTIVRTGKYLVHASWATSSLNHTAIAAAYIAVDGTIVRELQHGGNSASTGTVEFGVTELLSLTAGAFVTMEVFQNDGSPMNTITSAKNRPSLFVVEIR